MAINDLYKRLQVDPLADSVVIRAAFHALARKYHPDAGGDLRRMVEINEAWAVLGNPMMRSGYDTEQEQGRKPVATSDWADPRVGDHPGHGERPRPAGNDSTSTLDFGRYTGWSLGQLVDKDPDYLEWLTRTSIGRRLTSEITALLEVRAVSRAAVAVGARDRKSAGHDWLGRAKSR
jgi:curved DNA-binding protein CbpA